MGIWKAEEVVSVWELVQATQELLRTKGRPVSDETRRQIKLLEESLGSACSLKNIFVPSIRRQRIGRLNFMYYLDEPPRWSEPSVKKLLGNYLDLLSNLDQRHRANLANDPVYQQVINPELRDLFDRRKGATQYQKYMAYIKATPTLALPSVIRAITTVNKSERSLDFYKKTEAINNKLNALPPAILAIEAGITSQTAERWREEGMSGSEIMDFAFIIRHKDTSGQVVRELVSVKVPDEEWSDLIDIARRMNVSVRWLAKFLVLLEAEEIYGLVDEFSSVVQEIAERRHRHVGSVWLHVLRIYCREGGHYLDRTWDILEYEGISADTIHIEGA